MAFGKLAESARPVVDPEVERVGWPGFDEVVHEVLRIFFGLTCRGRRAPQGLVFGRHELASRFQAFCQGRLQQLGFVALEPDLSDELGWHPPAPKNSADRHESEKPYKEIGHPAFLAADV